MENLETRISELEINDWVSLENHDLRLYQIQAISEKAILLAGKWISKAKICYITNTECVKHDVDGNKVKVSAKEIGIDSKFWDFLLSKEKRAAYVY